MPNESGDGPLVSADELETLADVFDRYFYADDPHSSECKLARIEFDNRVETLHSAALSLDLNNPTLQQQISKITLKDFHSYLSCRCREIIKCRNRKPKSI
jgi:hypothetical protein